jgi:hypothetical protein
LFSLGEPGFEGEDAWDHRVHGAPDFVLLSRACRADEKPFHTLVGLPGQEIENAHVALDDVGRLKLKVLVKQRIRLPVMLDIEDLR